ncbi:MAG: peptidoglycan editing factor PgeF [Methylophilaceae bacterium]
MESSKFIIPNWPAPNNVKSIQTTRLGGVSMTPYDSLNFGMHVKDNPLHVARNRQLLSQFLPSEPVWLNQVHGVNVLDASTANCVPEADASFTIKKNVVCITMTADCLPVLLCNQQGTIVASIHAGWRSLCDGVIEATVEKMGIQPSDLMAWLGPAIGPQAFEVGSEVRAQFIAADKPSQVAFMPHGEKWLANIYTIARQRLSHLGVSQIYGGGLCTYTDQVHFFSFRRDGDTGRMATMIWLE